MSDSRLDFAFSIGVLNSARHGHGAVVGEHVAVEGIKRGVIDVGDQHALAQVVEHDESNHPAQPAKGLLMQFRPGARARLENEQTDRLAAVAEGQHEEASAPVLAALGVADHGAGAVIHLRFFAGRGHDHRVSFWHRCSAQLAHEAPHTLIAAGEAGLRHQVLPDGHGVAARARPSSISSRYGSQALAEGLREGGTAGTGRPPRRRKSLRQRRAVHPTEVRSGWGQHRLAGHLGGRFCRARFKG